MYGTVENDEVTLVSTNKYWYAGSQYTYDYDTENLLDSTKSKHTSSF